MGAHPTLHETGLAVSDQLHERLHCRAGSEAQAMLGDMLIGRTLLIEEPDFRPLSRLPECMQGIARDAIDRAIAVDGAHDHNRISFYQLFGIIDSTYSPADPTLEIDILFDAQSEVQLPLLQIA
jgi:hypothetical protein